MIGALTLHTLRECHRRPFLYVAASSILLLAVASRLLLAFTFGSAALETVNLAISAVFLVCLTHAAFLGTAAVRTDLDRGTYQLLLAKPLGSLSYLLGKLCGLCASSAETGFGVAFLLAAILALIPAQEAGTSTATDLALGCLPVLLALPVLQAAALAISCAVHRLAGPPLLVALFLLGSIAAGTPLAWAIPDYALYGLEAGARPPLLLLTVYTALFSSLFLFIAFIFLASKVRLRGQG